MICVLKRDNPGSCWSSRSFSTWRGRRSHAPKNGCHPGLGVRKRPA